MYKKSNLIICVTKSFKQDLVNRGIDKNKIKVIENGFDLSKNLQPLLSINEVEEKFKINRNTFYVSIGTIGMAHGLEIVLNAALKQIRILHFLLLVKELEKIF